MFDRHGSDPNSGCANDGVCKGVILERCDVSALEKDGIVSVLEVKSEEVKRGEFGGRWRSVPNFPCMCMPLRSRGKR